MAITYKIYTATGGQTSFVVTFPFIDSSHIKVDINGTATSAFTYNSGTSSVVLTSGAAADDKVKVWRETPGRSESAKILLVDFQDGSVLSEADLDKVSLQLLYLAQEAEETGASSLPLDWDSNYDAQSKRIKNLSATVSGGNDAVTKDYADGLSLYGGSVSLPQSWAKVGSDFTGTTGDCTITLSSPTPSSDTDDLFVVSLNGLTQRPTTDFTVTESGGAYTLTLKMGSDTLNSADVVNIMNFGVARQWIKQPIKGDSASDVALTVQRHTDGQSANLQEWVTEAGTPVVLASVNEDGDASFVDITATGATTLTGGVSGNLNLLTGALQLAGSSAMQVMSITASVGTGAVSNVRTTTGYNSGNYFVTGNTITVTPKSTSSKFILLGSTAGYGTIGNGVAVQLVKGNTASGGSTTDGTTISPTIFSTKADSASEQEYDSFGLFGYCEPNTTSETKFDLVQRITNSDATDTASVYTNVEYTQFWAIEFV